MPSDDDANATPPENTRCWCKTYPGCPHRTEHGRRLCEICRGAGHRAYTEAQVAAMIARRKEKR